MKTIFGIPIRKKELNKEELETIHHLLSIFYDKSKPKNTDFDDALYLRMKIKEVVVNKYGRFTQ